MVSGIFLVPNTGDTNAIFLAIAGAAALALLIFVIKRRKK